MATAHTVYKMVAETSAELDERNDLILQELPQVHYIAARMHERLPNQVEFADLVQAGVIGLISAYRAFDPTKNAQFSTFAKFRIEARYSTACGTGLGFARHSEEGQGSLRSGVEAARIAWPLSDQRRDSG